jgi:Ca-activated chloride channel homolog
MKRLLVALGLVVGLNLHAGETLRLKVESEREYLLKGAPQEVVVKIDLSVLKEKTKPRRLPLNLAVVLDRSGSMAGAKIEKARQAAMALVDQLRPGDTFALIAYSDQAEVILSSQEIRDAEAVKARIASIQPSGCTALYAGVQAGASQVREQLSGRKINRVILLSDGLANVGPSTPAVLRRLGGSLAEEGIAVTTIGVGEDYNETLMSGLAEASDANYYYVKDTEKLPEIFAKELGELLTVAAREVRVQISCPKGVTPIELIGRSELFHDQEATVRLNQLVLAQNRYLFLRCRVEGEQPELAQVTVRYRDELNDGAERSLSDRATVRFSSDRAQVANSACPEIIAQKELVVTAVEKDKALSRADGGDFNGAANGLLYQARVLDGVAATAPAAAQLQLRLESENLRNRANGLNNNLYDGDMRKSLQSESWNTRNSK